MNCSRLVNLLLFGFTTFPFVVRCLTTPLTVSPKASLVNYPLELSYPCLAVLNRAMSATMPEQAAPLPNPLPASPLPRRGKSRDRAQLVAMQQTLFELVQSGALPAHIRAACARAWADLHERKRIVDGKPLPGHLRPDLAPKAKRVLPSFRSFDAIDVSPGVSGKESLMLPGEGGGTPGG